MKHHSVNPRDVLERVIPFRFLSHARREALVPDLRVERYRAGAAIIRQGADDRRVYLLASGQVEVVDESGGTPVRTNLIEAEHYFGEWEPLFDVPRAFTISATVDSVCVALDGARFLELVTESAAFAQSLGVILRDQQGIFAAFDRFKVELMRGLNQGYLTIAKMLPLYTALQPAIHPLVASQAIDTAALSYVIRRLPDNVTRTFAYLLTDELPAAYRETGLLFDAVPTAARRRDVWEMLPGSSIVLLRNGLSDLVDLISCLCLYAVEARKIRRRFPDGEVVARLVRAAERGEAADSSLPLRADELAGLAKIWGPQTPTRLLDIVKHRETFSITIRRHSEKYNSRRAELWTKQLADACRDLLGADPAELDPELPVHIVSSNTHSVGNCLSSWYTREGDAMRAWAAASGHALVGRSWANEYDLLYAIARDYFLANPDAAERAAAAERDQGILRLRETASTGIQVQLIDTNRVCRSAVDPDVIGSAGGQPGLIVNIDYAFGAQAEHVLRNLLLLFSRNVRSVSLLGKAGALVGARGDVLVPTGFVEQAADQFYETPSCSRDRLEQTRESLQARLRGAQVHAGAMLTVDGTLLQNRDMLRFYRYIWSCIGMEMEGAYYFRQFREAQHTGLIRDDVEARFFYYVSDIPLDHGANLSARLEPHEGVPPLYAITREVLAALFADS